MTTNQKLRLTKARKNSAAAAARLAVEFTLNTHEPTNSDARLAFTFMLSAAVTMTAAVISVDCARTWGQEQIRRAWDNGLISRTAHNDLIDELPTEEVR